MKNKENNSKTLKWIYGRIKRYIPLTAVVSVISALSALSFVALALITKKVLDVATNETAGSIIKNGILLFAGTNHCIDKTYIEKFLFDAEKTIFCCSKMKSMILM